MPIYKGIEHLDKLDTTSFICFDTETLQLQPERCKMRLVQLGSKSNDTVVLIDCFDLEQPDWETLRAFFANPVPYWLAHNAVFDLGWLQAHNIYPTGHVLCTMLASRLITNGIPNQRHTLDSLSKRFLNTELAKELQKSDWGGDLTDAQLDYAANDVFVLMQLEHPIMRKLASNDLNNAFMLECAALPAMAQMWRTGLHWNAENLQQRKEDYEFDIKALAKEFVEKLDAALPEEEKLPRDDDGSFNLRAKDQGKIRDGTKRLAGFNINSPKQLVHKLTALLGKPPTDPDGKPSASRQALRAHAADHEVIQVYLEWKRCEKRRQMIESIQDKMDANGFVRASYMQLGAESGRMSCIKPNNQQIPRDPQFRGCVEAPDGYLLVDADFGQMELRLAASVANDDRMIKAFQAGEDPHTVTAEAIGCDRQTAKSANFGLLYGAGATGLRNYAGGMGVTMSEERAAEIRDGWLDTFQGIAEWQKQNALECQKTEGDRWASVRIPGSGMRRILKGDMNRSTVRCNTPIQGAGAAILKTALGTLWPLVKESGEDTVRIAAAVHDEILLLVREESAQIWAAILKKVMEDSEAQWLGEIPALAEVSIGKTWMETH